MKKIAVLLLVALCSLPATAQQPYENSIGMEFIKIPAGSFTMGYGDPCPKDDPFTNNDENADCSNRSERPAHTVRISKAFWMGKTEVTQEQWVAVMGSNPSSNKNRDYPVTEVSWNDAQSFIERLNSREKCKCYRLPTEAEWEYVASTSGATLAHAVYDRSSISSVGSRPADDYGLHDILGNVWEWTADWYGENYYAQSPATDPQGPSSGQYRVFRGGGWNYYAQNVRPGDRDNLTPADRNLSLGFRLLRTSP